MSERLLITNARLVNEGREFDADVLVADGRIARIADSMAAPAGARVMDAAGCLLLPGMIEVVFSHSIRATVGSGQVAWDDGRLNPAVRGQRLDVRASR